MAVTLAAEREVGSRLTLAVRAEDVLVAAVPVAGLSARNAYPARVVSLERTGVDVTLRCALEARRRAAGADHAGRGRRRSGLAAGRPVWLAVKSHSIRLV